MSATDIETSEITKWDPVLTERVMGLLKPFLKGWHRAEVRGLENFPVGGALVVA
ncbi:glycerol acyltransferase, partial [Mycobacterium sp. ITM-2017-0098]